MRPSRALLLGINAKSLERMAIANSLQFSQTLFKRPRKPIW